MPKSIARAAFDENMEDVNRLLNLHTELGGTSQGRRWGLEVLNKSAIVLICSFWEAYCEDIAAEGLLHLVEHAGSPDVLPEPLRRQIAKELRDDRHDLAPWALADDGWRNVLMDRLEDLRAERNRKLNTPKASNIDELFARALGIDRISDAWTWDRTTPERARQKLDKYVTLRGTIAHRGKAATSVQKRAVEEFKTHATKLVAKTGGRVNGVVRAATGQRIF